MAILTYGFGRNILVIRPDRNTKASDYTGAFKPDTDAFCRAVKASGSPDPIVYEFDASVPHPARAKPTLAAIADAASKFATRDGLSTLVLCCHGWTDGTQSGLLRKHAKAVAALLAPPAPMAGADQKALVSNAALLADGWYGMSQAKPLHVVLWCCSTGKPGDGTADKEAASGAPGGDNGFADKLRDELCAIGLTWCRVYAHTTDGDCTRNPNVRVFEGLGSPVGGVGGEWIVPPPSTGIKSALWATWRDALWAKNSWAVGKLLCGGNAKDFRLWAPFMTRAERIAELGRVLQS